MLKISPGFKKGLAVAGLALSLLVFGLNVFGLFQSLEYPGLARMYKNTGEAPPLEDWAAQARRRPNEPDLAFARRMTTLVNRRMIYFWPPEQDDSFNVLPWENFFIWLDLLDETDTRYQYQNPFKALERGVGICSQHAMALAGLLVPEGVGARVVGLRGHVVVEARLDGRPCILDATKDVVLPYSIQQVGQTPSLIYSAYREKGFQPSYIARLEKIYGPEGNYFWDYRVPVSFWEKCLVEESRRYILKWLVPALLGLGCALALARGARRPPG